jgi:major membrane immunogen (membrane-anchored lipoprotein)
MKRIVLFIIVLLSLFTLAACAGKEAAQGDYIPGTYFGYTEGHQNTLAVVFVDENGFIAGIFVDSVYLQRVEDGPVSWTQGTNVRVGIATTKMSLNNGCGYNMWPSQPVVDCQVEGQTMWVQQVANVIEAVIDAQGIPALEGDTIAGATITITPYITAIQAALDKAKK